MEYGNGIVGDMCVHMLDMVRWMLGSGLADAIASTGGILVDKQSKANISDTQTATFDYPDSEESCGQHRTWGEPRRPKYPWARDILRRQRHAEGRASSATTSSGGQEWQAVHKTSQYEFEQYPRTRRKGPRAARRARDPPPHAGFSGGIDSAAGRSRTSSRATSRRPRCILAEHLDEAGPQSGAGMRSRATSEKDDEANRVVAPAVPEAVESSRSLIAGPTDEHSNPKSLKIQRRNRARAAVIRQRFICGGCAAGMGLWDTECGSPASSRWSAAHGTRRKPEASSRQFIRIHPGADQRPVRPRRLVSGRSSRDARHCGAGRKPDIGLLPVPLPERQRAVLKTRGSLPSGFLFHSDRWHDFRSGRERARTRGRRTRTSWSRMPRR